jgi:hypothetical protein
MQPFTLLVATLFGSLAAAAALAPTCTNTVLQTPGCCKPVSLYTATEHTACSGCALITKPAGPVCDLVCQKTQTVSATTTVTACATCTSTTTIYRPACIGCIITKSAETVTKSIDCHGCALEAETKIVGGFCAPVC